MIVLLYLSSANYFGNGQTPGKWAARIRLAETIVVDVREQAQQR
jgi:uncharacterized RDD family membrane protein YckC